MHTSEEMGRYETPEMDVIIITPCRGIMDPSVTGTGPTIGDGGDD